MKKHNYSWTRSDTRAAHTQLEMYVLADSIGMNMEHKPFVPDAVLADAICYFYHYYKEGIISTKNFLRVVKDISGGTY